jgi:hypothetical protein
VAIKYNLPETVEMRNKLLRYQELFLITDKTTGEQAEYNQLINDLESYQIRAEDFNNKVDKEAGKGLSTNDFTTEEKTKLAGIAAEANKYVLPVATSGAVGGVKSGGDITVAGDGAVTVNGKLALTGGTMGGILTAHNNTAYTTKQVRNIILSTEDANPSLMENGDIWIKYAP